VFACFSVTHPDAALTLFAPYMHDRDGWILAMSWITDLGRLVCADARSVIAATAKSKDHSGSESKSEDTHDWFALMLCCC